MGNLLGGSDSGSKIAKQQAEAQQRRQLADLARQQAEVDQASAGKTGRKTGSRLLTFLNLSGDGASKFGDA